MFMLLLGIQYYMHLQPGVFNLAAGDMPQRDTGPIIHPPTGTRIHCTGINGDFSCGTIALVL